MTVPLSFFSSSDCCYFCRIRLFFCQFICQSNTCFGMVMIERYCLKLKVLLMILDVIELLCVLPSFQKGMHSLCPALWSKHRRWRECSLRECLQSQKTSVFVPLCGGLLQVQGQYPGDMKFSFSCKVWFNNAIDQVYNHCSHLQDHKC